MLQSLKKTIREFFLQGIDWVLASGHSSRGLSPFSVVGGGAGTDTVLFSSYGMPDMADTSYQVIVNGESVAATHVDESSKTVHGFDVLGLGLNEVGHVLVVGRFAGMPTE